MDPGYLSRCLRQLELDQCVALCDSANDRRQRLVSLTDRGRMAARELERYQEYAVQKVLEELPARQQRRLVHAMNTIIEVFNRDALTNLLERVRDGARGID